MIAILVNAYACAPNMGSEPGMAWNWIINLANYCKVHIITEGEWQNEIEAAVKLLPQANNLKFYYNPVSDKIRKMCWNQGDWRFYYYYMKWQQKTLKISEDIIKKHKIDLVHQLNMIGFREPGFLWKIEDKPFVWGPVDAKESFPVSYLKGANLKSIISIRLKNYLNVIQLKHLKRVYKAVDKASFVISASSESVKTFKKYYNCNSILINETGCYEKEQGMFINDSKMKTFDILWVGKFDFRKQLGLALETIAKINLPNVLFHIIGDDQNKEALFYKQMAVDLNISKQCVWHGKIPHQQVQEIMQTSALFFFTSVAEGTPHVVLESIGNNLPVLCFNTCGQGDAVNEKVGVKIELSNAAQSINDFSTKIAYLYNNSDVLKKLSDNCAIRQLELSWDRKAQQMLEVYKEAIKKIK